MRATPENEAERMRVFHGFDALPSFRRPVVTVGSFDGVHLGHRALIERLVEHARSTGSDGIVLTFEPHPRVILGRAEGLRLLTTLEEKTALLGALGVDALVVIPFNRAFSALTGADFLDRYLIGKLGAGTLVVGYNHRFGHDGADCRHLAAQRGVQLICVDERSVGGEHVSSTVIRNLLARGERTEAERLAGHALHPQNEPNHLP